MNERHIPTPLYRSADLERDACGIAALADLRGRSSHELIERALSTLAAIDHRGARVHDEFGGTTGDGCGLLTDLPHTLFRPFLERRGRATGVGDYGVATLFLPLQTAAESQSVIEETLLSQGIEVAGWREVPTDDTVPGLRARDSQPIIAHLFLLRPSTVARGFPFERALYLARLACERALRAIGYRAYFVSCSSRTVVYKGMLTPDQLPRFYLDLRDPRATSRVAVVHTRFSTNTSPTWERAQPFRRLCHNGEINTLQGNIHWMRAREAALPAALRPVIDPRGSDSAMLDNVLELLTLGGERPRDPASAMTRLIPPAYEHDPSWGARERAFFAHQSALQEPWDGPAGVCFTDGRVVGASLDRNGLRPMRYDVSHDGLLAVASEAGAAGLDPQEVAHHGRLAPGQMVLADVEDGYWLDDSRIKRRLASRSMYTAPDIVACGATEVANDEGAPVDADRLIRLQAAFGYTSEEINVILKPMVWGGKEPIGSMGDDTPHAVLSEQSRPLAHFFKQRFAEVTNPPIDPLRERAMMSLRCHLGPLSDPLASGAAVSAGRIALTSPFLSPAQLAALEGGTLATARLDATFDPAETLEEGLDHLFAAAERAVEAGAVLLILSDRAVEAGRLPIPSLLAVGGLHHHLLRADLRSRVSLVAESGEARDTHSLAALIGFGANALCPWLALESAIALGGRARRGEVLDPALAIRRYLAAAEAGLLKIMSKMGIGPVESYCGAQLFEILGLSETVTERFFAGTPTRIGGVGLERLEDEVRRWHQQAAAEDQRLESPGFFKFKKGGEYHAYSPAVVHALQAAARTEGALNGHFDEGYARYQQYTRLLYGARPAEPRDLLHLRAAEEPLIPLDVVEPRTALFRRFSTAAMSLGSLSREAHETLAIAMNRLGGMSNSGEGGEAADRFQKEGNSAIKQVASGRFGVTPAYLLSARELQIKMAQGSKPGEGGHLPGHKVTAEIAALRHTVPGVGLISPPPHHDIYSIEDLAQLISDLRQINPAATISVKLVAQAGVGTIAAGVVKAGADVIMLSGHSGGTGASPLTSIKHAGEPWEIGLAETQQVLVEQRLRGRVRLRVDGGLRTGRDVIVAALLGAEEFSFGTAALVAEGCLMARACHKNTCPVGIATQRPDLRAKFDGTPEQVMAFFHFLAEECREWLARLGARSLDEIVGQTHLLEARPNGEGLDLTPLLRRVALSGPRRHNRRYHRPAEPMSLGERVARDVQRDLSGLGRSSLHYPISNQDRTVGARLAGLLAARGTPLDEDAVELFFRGYAGQSFGAFSLPGTTIVLEGVANDYTGKGLAGGTLTLMRPEGVTWSDDAPLLGNVALYGATAGRFFAAGAAGERFAVRNSGADAVVEGVGAHGCEYMTGGTVVILGPVGANFGAGMTGGRAFVFDPEGRLEERLNPEFVSIFVPTAAELDEIENLVRDHAQRSGSPVARRLLAAWSSRAAGWRLVTQPDSRTPRPEPTLTRANPLTRSATTT